MKAIVKIINIHFWKSIIGPFFAFVFPVIFLVILGTLLGYDALFGSIVSIPSTTIALTVLPTALFEFKNSSLLKRIGVSSIKPWVFILSISIYYVIIMIISTLTTILFGLIIFSKYFNDGRLLSQPFNIYAPSLKNILLNVNYLGLIWSILWNIILSTSIGIFISTVCKSTVSIQGIGIAILILSEFLAAQVLPISMVREVDALYYLSYITPFKYSTGLIINSWNGQLLDIWSNEILQLNSNPVSPTPTYLSLGSTSNIFNFQKTFYIINYKFESTTINFDTLTTPIFTTYDKVLNMFMPIIFSGLFFGLTLKTFKWGSR